MRFRHRLRRIPLAGVMVFMALAATMCDAGARSPRDLPDGAPGIPRALDPGPFASLASTDGDWQKTLPTLARYGSSAIYDPVRHRLLVFGGWDGAYSDELWELPLAGGSGWSRLAPAGTPPPGRFRAAAVYDPVRDRMLVFGGARRFGGVTTYFNDVWSLSLAGTPTWSPISPAGPLPPVREGHVAVYDPVRDRMIVFGGYSFDGSDHHWSDTWSLALSGSPGWTEITPGGALPQGRFAPCAIYDPVRDRMIVHGGYYFDGVDHYLRDAWTLSLAGAPTWTQLAIANESLAAPIEEGAAIYDPVRDRMVVFGGWDGGGDGDLFNGIEVLSLAGTPAWDMPAVSGSPGPGRFAHVMVYDAALDRLVVFGGLLDHSFASSATARHSRSAARRRGAISRRPGASPAVAAGRWRSTTRLATAS